MKSIPLLTCALLLSGTSAFSQQQAPAKEKGCKEEPMQSQCLKGHCAAFNAPAAIDVNHKTFRCTTMSDAAFVDASFTYWYAGEEGLNLASNGQYDTGTSTSYYPINGKILSQTSNYKPGFKVGLGIVGNHEWVFHAEYTWYRAKNNTNSGTPGPTSGGNLTAGTIAALSGSNVWLVNDWYQQGTTAGQALAGTQVESQWKLAMDLIDVVAGRPFYQARCVVISPFAGLRAAFIRQSMNVQLTETPLLFGSTFGAGTSPNQPIGSRNHSNSWAIGPRMGFDGYCLLPMGFRFEGDLATSLLYTRYTSIKHAEDVASTAFNKGPYRTMIRGYNCLRPMAELGLGFGWGRYVSSNDFHIDFSADYNFMYFWSQNMMRKMLDDNLTGTSPAASDLYMHGLTVTGRFDF